MSKIALKIHPFTSEMIARFTYHLLALSYILLTSLEGYNNFQQKGIKMSFLDKDFYSLRKDEKAFEDNYESGYSCFSRMGAMLHLLGYLIHVHTNINKKKVGQSQNLTNDDVKGIRFDQSAEFLSQEAAKHFLQIQAQLAEGEKLTADSMLKFILRLFKDEVLYLLALYLLDALLRIGISVLILYLFNAVSDNSTKQAYVYAAAVLVTWYLDQLAKHASFLNANIFYGRIRSALGMLLYSKVSSLSSSIIKNSEVGKITNLIASDLGALQYFPLSFGITLFPLMAIGSIILLVLRMGWPGVLGILVATLTFPLSNCISKFNGSLIEEVNIHKDRRIENTSEAIEGIKFVKLYGWETAFRRMIHSIRELQMGVMRRLCIGKGMDKALMNSVCMSGAFIMFLVAHYVGTELTVARMFSSLEVLFSFKYVMDMLSTALEQYYSCKVV